MRLCIEATSEHRRARPDLKYPPPPARVAPLVRPAVPAMAGEEGGS